MLILHTLTDLSSGKVKLLLFLEKKGYTILNTDNNDKNIDIRLEIKINSYTDLKRAVKNLNEIQKEYSCNCTLFAKTISSVIRD